MDYPDKLLNPGYVYVMAIRRITISVPEDVARRLKAAAGDTPVSARVTQLIEEHLEEADLQRLWLEFYRDVSPSPADVRRARSMLTRIRRPARRQRTP